MFQRFVRHNRPQVGAAYADVDEIAYDLTGVAPPLAAADVVGEIGHLVQHAMNLRHYVLAVDDDRGSFRGAQCRVQYSSFFGHIDLLAAEHRVTPLRDTSLSGELNEQSNSFIGYAIFGEVEIQVRALDSKAFSASGSSANNFRKWTSLSSL